MYELDTTLSVYMECKRITGSSQMTSETEAELPFRGRKAYFTGGRVVFQTPLPTFHWRPTRG